MPPSSLVLEQPAHDSHAGVEGEEEADWLTRLERTLAAARRTLQPYRHLLVFSAGVVTCFCGRHFTYSPFFWRSFSVIGWPVTRHAAGELLQRFRAAQSAVQRELPGGLPSLEEAGSMASQAIARLQAVYAAYETAQSSGDAVALERLSAEMWSLQEDLARARQTGSAFTAASEELERRTLLELARGLHASLVASLKAGMLDSAQMLGLHGVNIGDVVATSINRRAAPQLRAWIDVAVSCTGRDVQQLAEDQNARTFVAYAVRSLSNGLGIVAASYVEALAFMFANARMGAKLMAQD
mmetsp:Transcript_53533/g.165737  ORF Transcript_53533/g.165737 Transcript_53533/m.165737 type:complete len:297 (+) Transcript_53533:64-954(+)